MTEQIFFTGSYWLFLFFSYNVMGWIIESAFESACHKRFINRGSLFGPYIPIYGFGAVIFSLLGTQLRGATDSPWLNAALVFAVCMGVATLLEYMVGGILERLFKKQFWDYSTLKLTCKFTYKNRISLFSSFFFGVCALFVTYFLYEQMWALTQNLNFYFVAGFNAVMAIAMGVDIVIQVRKYYRLRDLMKKLSYEQVRETLLNMMLQMGDRAQIAHFREAVRHSTEALRHSTETIRKNISETREVIAEKTEELRNNIAEKTDSLKQNITDRKDAITEKFSRTPAETDDVFLEEPLTEQALNNTAELPQNLLGEEEN